MKKLINQNRLILLLILAFAKANAYDATQDVNANYESTYSSELTDRKVYDSTINNTDIIEAGSDKAALKTWENNRAGIIQEKETYFIDMEFTSCMYVSDIICPPLKPALAAEGYRTRINSLDLKNGKISCSVLRPLRDWSVPLTFRSEQEIFKKTFLNKACLQKFSPKSFKNKDWQISTQKLIKENDSLLFEIHQQEAKYTVDYKQNGDDEFLDLADTVDGLVSFNANIFDFEKTLLTRDLKTRSGFTTLPNETIITKFQDTFNNFLTIFGIGEYDDSAFQDSIENQATIRDTSSAMVNSSFYMLLEFWLKANEAIVIIAQGLALLFVGYNVIFTWVSPALTNKMQQKDSGENSGHRGIFGFIMILMFWAGDVQKISISYDTVLEDSLKTELTVQQTNIQSLIQLLYSETNYWADTLAKIGIKAYLNTLNASTGLFDKSQIIAMSNEKVILSNELITLASIDKEMCFSNFEVKLIKDKLSDYRTMTLSKGEDNSKTILSYAGIGASGVGSLKANPFPKSEREAEAMMYYDKDGQKYNNSSAYNAAWSKYDDGVVKQTSANKFRMADYSPLSLSGCYYNRKKMIDNKSRIADIDAQFAKLSDPAMKNAKAQYLKVVNEIQWSLFAKQGYLAVAYLPATALLIDNIGIAGDLNESQDAVKNSLSIDDDGVINKLATDELKSLASQLPYLAIFGGMNIAKIIHKVKEPLISGTLDVFSLATAGETAGIGGILGQGAKYLRKAKNLVTFKDSEVDIFDLKLAAWLIENMMKTMITVTLIVGSILIFTLLFIEKLFAFVSSMFLLIYVFSKNQEERVSTAIAKIFAVAFKTVLIVVCIVMSLFALSLVNNLETVFIESFFKSMDMIENASWRYKLQSYDLSNLFALMTLFLQKYLFYGLSKMAFMALKLVLVLNMIWKMPGYMYELIYEKVHSVSDGVADTLQGATENRTIKF
ncbi:hypothetical protein CRV08_01990 [Halarcobacter ebronensis]|uniref:Uncharacterized protein n=1 Tax=Halarcobacter ebronensis TaxID=1462615 RepID=A0A4Q0YFV2_9BACT|nr:hypothetical protein [Halarcobacter ebronensis]RXJ69496.1 hypothetical protein CRV08_01990 [Halarcobacter ebronensis]